MRFFIVIVRAPICPLYQEAWQRGNFNNANGKTLHDLKIAIDVIVFCCHFFFLAILGIQIDCNMEMNTRATSRTSLNISLDFIYLHAVYNTTQT